MLAACAGPPRPEPNPCDWSGEGIISLTERDARDVVSVSVSGASCPGSIVMLAIRTSDGRNLYEFEAPLPVFFSVSGNASEMPADPETSVRRLVDELVQPQVFRSVGSLPSWATGEVHDGLRYYQYLLPEGEVTRLEDQPLFYHAAGWEHGFELALDPRAGGVVRVLESWR